MLIEFLTVSCLVFITVQPTGESATGQELNLQSLTNLGNVQNPSGDINQDGRFAELDGEILVFRRSVADKGKTAWREVLTLHFLEIRKRRHLVAEQRRDPLHATVGVAIAAAPVVAKLPGDQAMHFLVKSQVFLS